MLMVGFESLRGVDSATLLLVVLWCLVPVTGVATLLVLRSDRQQASIGILERARPLIRRHWRVGFSGLLLLATLILFVAGLRDFLGGEDHRPLVDAAGRSSVSSGAPFGQIAIDSVDIDAPLSELRLENSSWTFFGPEEVVWNVYTGRPGSGQNAVLYGHLDWTDSGAVFANLWRVNRGDTITIRTQDGGELVYAVTRKTSYTWDELRSSAIEAPTKGDVITLITCGGTFEPDPSEPYGGRYSHALVVRAERAVGAAQTPRMTWGSDAITSEVTDGGRPLPPARPGTARRRHHLPPPPRRRPSRFPQLGRAIPLLRPPQRRSARLPACAAAHGAQARSYSPPHRRRRRYR